jgi:hypothetical protein
LRRCDATALLLRHYCSYNELLLRCYCETCSNSCSNTQGSVQLILIDVAPAHRRHLHLELYLHTSAWIPPPWENSGVCSQCRPRAGPAWVRHARMRVHACTAMHGHWHDSRTTLKPGFCPTPSLSMSKHHSLSPIIIYGYVPSHTMYCVYTHTHTHTHADPPAGRGHLSARHALRARWNRRPALPTTAPTSEARQPRRS